MALTELIFGERKRVTIGKDVPLGLGLIQFDAAIEETYLDEAEVTSHSIEDGSDVSDHIRKLPETYELTGRVTNTPLVFLASRFGESPVKNTAEGAPLPIQEDRVTDAYNLLLQIQATGTLSDISTSLRDYTDMAITSLIVRRNAETGQVLDCTVALQKIKKAKSLSVDLPVPVKVQNKKASNKGKKDKKGGTGKQTEKSQSILSQFAALFGG